MARKNPAVRREEVLAATVEEIEATGLRTLRVSDVAARLGLSASLIIYHFETKEALVAAAFDYAGRQDIDRARELAAGTDSGREVSAGTVSARERLRAVVGWYLPSGSSRSWKIWIDGWSAGLFDEELKSTFAAMDREWKSILARLMEEAIAAGECAAPTSGVDAPTRGAETPTGGTDARATRILAFLDGLAIQMMVNPEAVEAEQLRVWADDFLTHELG
ncbi:TetR/AcrR family transcriptional regulator [Brevibacterium oceani]|uniref:TetR/AcrR family transcriptional regulator n=1 Tax=Brevibacterium oceani TaxID=358099 RepID=UPI001FE9528B|nr:TetR family transcriptional regulator C-terminal domain-containing protein [Brevibacterium oceani]